MTVTEIARKDFEDAVRSRMLWGIMAVFVGFMAFVIVIALNTADAAEATSGRAMSLIAQLAQLFVPLIALIAGYLAIVGERRAGSLRILLGYPHSRRDVVLGKLLGRSAVIAVTLSVGSLLTAGLVAATIAVPDPVNAAGVLGSIVLFGVAFAGVAVGISAAVRTRGKAMALAIGLLLIFLVIWDALAALTYQAVTGALPGLKVEAWYFLFLRISPIAAFRALADGFVTGPISDFFVWGLEQIPRDTSPEQLTVANRVRGPLPFYLTEWFAAATLLMWGVVPAIIGYTRFRDSDL